jgi:hypothetical protein
MPRKPTVPLTAAQEHEIAALYSDSKTKTREIYAAYGVNPRQLYRVLERQGISLRKPQATRNRSNAMMSAPLNGHHSPLTTAPLTVTVDAQGTVVAAERDERAASGMPVWTITYQGVISVRGASIEDAIYRAKANPEVRRIVGAVQRESAP